MEMLDILLYQQKHNGSREFMPRSGVVAGYAWPRDYLAFGPGRSLAMWARELDCSKQNVASGGHSGLTESQTAKTVIRMFLKTRTRGYLC